MSGLKISADLNLFRPNTLAAVSAETYVDKEFIIFVILILKR